MSASKIRLDQAIAERGLAPNRTKASAMIDEGQVKVDGKLIDKPGYFVSISNQIEVAEIPRFVSRGANKLASVAKKFKLDFAEKVVLDVGSSTGGFTDYALQNGAQKVIAVDVGTDQLHLSLRNDSRIELHEKTDIRNFITSENLDLVLIDVSFISLRQILPTVNKVSNQKTQIIAMVKPQFEAGKEQTNKGVIKNDSQRRQILKDFEAWAKQSFVILAKSDSGLAGAKGNVERFYLLRKIT